MGKLARKEFSLLFLLVQQLGPIDDADTAGTVGADA